MFPCSFYRSRRWMDNTIGVLHKGLVDRSGEVPRLDVPMFLERLKAVFASRAVPRGVEHQHQDMTLISVSRFFKTVLRFSSIGFDLCISHTPTSVAKSSAEKIYDRGTHAVDYFRSVLRWNTPSAIPHFCGYSALSTQ